VTPALLVGLSKFNVTLIHLVGHLSSPSDLIPLLSNHFSNTRSLHLEFPTKTDFIAQKPSINFLPNLPALRMLKIFNMEFDFDETVNRLLPRKYPIFLIQVPRFYKTIQSIRVENSSLSTVPKWMAFSMSLNRLIIDGTRLGSLIQVSQIRSLSILKLPRNRIDDLHRVSFIGDRLHEIDLSYNRVSAFKMLILNQCLLDHQICPTFLSSLQLAAYSRLEAQPDRGPPLSRSRDEQSTSMAPIRQYSNYGMS
jgi:hypothetical protein